MNATIRAGGQPTWPLDAPFEGILANLDASQPAWRHAWSRRYGAEEPTPQALADHVRGQVGAGTEAASQGAAVDASRVAPSTWGLRGRLP